MNAREKLGHSATVNVSKFNKHMLDTMRDNAEALKAKINTLPSSTEDDKLIRFNRLLEQAGSMKRSDLAELIDDALFVVAFRLEAFTDRADVHHEAAYAWVFMALDYLQNGPRVKVH